MSYPDTYLRGIPNSSGQFLETLTKNSGKIIPTLSVFSSGFAINEARSDNNEELSINWIDDEGAFEVAFQQFSEKKQSLQFQGGVCVFDLGTLKTLATASAFSEYITYERSELPNNIYHGNIVLDADTTKNMKNLICGTLAASVVEHKANPNI